MRLGWLILAAVAICPAWGRAASAQIPEAFVGEWSVKPSKCGRDGDKSLLVIETSRIAQGNSSGPVRAAVTRGRELALIVELSEGHATWLSAQQYVISAHGGRLVSNVGGKRSERQRCSSGARPNNSSKPTPLRGAA